MSVKQEHEVRQYTRDWRTPDQKIGDILAQTWVSAGVVIVAGVLTIFYPWCFHITGAIAFMWYLTVVGDPDRQILPLQLPAAANVIDRHNIVAGKTLKAAGRHFLGNAVKTARELWETSDLARRHKLILATTGGGKSEMLMGLVANALACGSGAILSDAKGTVEMYNRCYMLFRRFGRDDDAQCINYMTGGVTIRKGSRNRLSNRTNAVAFMNADAITQMFASYLPKSSGENQVFQDRALTQLAATAPALVDLRDLADEFLTVNSFRDAMSNINTLIRIAHDPDNKLSPESREKLRKYLASLPNFDPAIFNGAPPENGVYKVDKETAKQFGYGAQYFNRALSNLADTYWHIYLCKSGEVDYIDTCLNRRLLVIILPAMEKSPAELQQLAKTNLTNIRGALSTGLGSLLEGFRADRVDNLPTASNTVTKILLDEYGYQSTEGFAITTAQARGLNFEIVIAGQDLSNLEMGSKDEAEAIFGNAVLIVGQIRNVKNLAERIEKFVGEADVATLSSAEKNSLGTSTGYIDEGKITYQRRTRITGSDLGDLRTGEAYMFPGQGMGYIHFYPFAPLPGKSNYVQINRCLEIVVRPDRNDANSEGLAAIDRLIANRMDGWSTVMDVQALPKAIIEALAGGASISALNNMFGALRAIGGDVSNNSAPATPTRYDILPGHVQPQARAVATDAHDAGPPRKTPVGGFTAEQFQVQALPPVITTDFGAAGDSWTNLADRLIDLPKEKSQSQPLGQYSPGQDKDWGDQESIHNLVFTEATSQMVEEVDRNPVRYESQTNAAEIANQISASAMRSTEYRADARAPEGPLNESQVIEFVTGIGEKLRATDGRDDR